MEKKNSFKGLLWHQNYQHIITLETVCITGNGMIKILSQCYLNSGSVKLASVQEPVQKHSLVFYIKGEAVKLAMKHSTHFISKVVVVGNL